MGSLAPLALGYGYRSVRIQVPPCGAQMFLAQQIDNEVDLCYEWACSTNEGGTRPFAQTASEYAHMLDQVITWLQSSGMLSSQCVDCRGTLGLADHRRVTLPR